MDWCSHTTVGDLTVVPFLVPVSRVAPWSVHVVIWVSAALMATHKDRINKLENVIISQLLTLMSSLFL